MFRAILSVFNPLVYVLSVCFQTTLIYTIIRHSPKNLSTLKIILLINCFSQSIQSSMAFITQIRYVSNLVPLQLWSYGPCRHFEAFICYSMMHVLQTSSLISGWTVFLTTFMKYQAAKHVVLPKKNIWIVICVIFAIISVSVACEIYLIIIQALPQDIRKSYESINKNLEEYSVIGIMNYSFLPSSINGVIVNGLVVVVPISCLTLRRKIFKLLSGPNKSSDTLYLQNRIFLQGLTFQIFGHILVYVPIYICTFISFITKTEYTFSQFFIFVLPSLTTVVDPVITMYFVTPYRKKLLCWMRSAQNKVFSASGSTFAVSIIN
ncbi:Serpentine Receptor, class D (Delta) [Caenorhabditis elegans]|uniref:Serpentine Receptor, class D (Delta) n=1 Tax=Caenorhabditis elegans TaxID=6239 RepID=Q21715_CAEEL|nr:Serpentine Receptor, class D (Delta) [Caenorhabditis elegans]CAA94165.3 Serpentine Receptor, class D (Delta) [Caenorhabditis elegans]|eukprot:NP_510214.2 Serpentine Receptor, class D (delta) [Caenorhabditis elegans]